MRGEQAEAIALAGGEPARELVVMLLGEGAELRERVEDLERRVDRDSGNSSMPPSSDPPKSRAERRRAAREAYKRSMRRSGGQPGHEGKSRELVTRERVDERVGHLPDCCGCGHEFDGSEERVGDPVVHQQFELPPIRPLVYEENTPEAYAAASCRVTVCPRRSSWATRRRVWRWGLRRV